MSHVPGKLSAQPPSHSTGQTMTFIRFIWLSYLLSALIHHFAYGVPVVDHEYMRGYPEMINHLKDRAFINHQ
jgi:hypothetical protein